MEMMCMRYAEKVYCSLSGQIRPELCIPGVENIFVPGGEYYENYGQVMEAYERLLARLNGDEDDIEIIINSLLNNEKIVALKMYEYGQSKPHP